MTDLDYILLDAVKRREKRRFNRIEKAHYDQLIATGFVRLTPSGEYRITKAGLRQLAAGDSSTPGDAMPNEQLQDTPADTMRDGTGDEAEES